MTVVNSQRPTTNSQRRICHFLGIGTWELGVPPARLLLGVLAGIVLAANILRAQQPPAPPELPPEYRGGEIDRAIGAHDWPRAEQLLVAAIEAPALSPVEGPALSRVEGEPTSPKLLQVLGSVFLIERKPLNAAIAIKKADALGPLDEGARYTLVLAYLSLHRSDWARPELERLAAAHPSNPTYEYWLGRTDYDAGQYASAVQRFTLVIAMDPEFVRAYDNLGLSYEALNRSDAAATAYRKAVEINRASASPSPWPPLNFAVMLKNQGGLPEADALLREATRYDEGFAPAHYQLGSVLEQRDHLDAAVAELARAAACDPEYAEPHYALARIYRRQGRAAAAAAALAEFERLHDAKRQGSAR